MNANFSDGSFFHHKVTQNERRRYPEVEGNSDGVSKGVRYDFHIQLEAGRSLLVQLLTGMN
jgi:hypothetical protein